MMPLVTLLGQNCTGHGCYPPRPNVSASATVCINGIPVHRQGDSWAGHKCPSTPTHGGVTAVGSYTVSANGMPIARVADPVSCGSIIAEGSPTVCSNGL